MAKKITTAGTVLRITRLDGLEDQDLLDGDIEDKAQGQQVVGAGKGLAALPFINGLRGFEAEVVLKVRDGVSLLRTKPLDIGAGCQDW